MGRPFRKAKGTRGSEATTQGMPAAPPRHPRVRVDPEASWFPFLPTPFGDAVLSSLCSQGEHKKRRYQREGNAIGEGTEAWNRQPSHQPLISKTYPKLTQTTTPAPHNEHHADHPLH